jgi:excisionase family DNA binding protein
VSVLISKETERTEYLMSPEELAKFLDLGRTYTYRLLAEGEIPCARIGRLLKVRRTDAEKFVEACIEHGGPDAV